MKTLIILFGQVRTLSHCIMSIYDKILVVNRPCHVVLSIDGVYQDIPRDVLDLLKPYLIDIYTTQNKDDVRRDNQIIEFFLVSKALERVHAEDYMFVLKIRTDIFVRQPIDLKACYAMCTTQHFENIFLSFCSNLSWKWKEELARTIKAFLLTGGQKFFIPRQLDPSHPPRSPWSTSHVYEWNAPLLSTIDALCDSSRWKKGRNVSVAYVHQIVRKLCQDFRVTFLIGSTWIHYGYSQDISRLSNMLTEEHTTLTREGVKGDDVLEWIDHKGEIRQMTQDAWRKVTDDQIRMVHHKYNYSLVDLVNDQDYIESFDATTSLRVNKKRADLFAWIVREKSVG